MVKRRREGLFVFYSVSDARVFEMCDVVCGSLAEHLARELSSFGEGAVIHSGFALGAPMIQRPADPPSARSPSCA